MRITYKCNGIFLLRHVIAIFYTASAVVRCSLVTVGNRVLSSTGSIRWVQRSPVRTRVFSPGPSVSFHFSYLNMSLPAPWKPISISAITCFHNRCKRMEI